MGRPRTVLWVDDEVESLEAHALFLREHGFEVELTANGDDALSLLRRQGYGVILLDEQMPGRRGLELVEEIRAVDAAVPIVMITKSEEADTMHEAIGIALDDYLVKPVNPRQVLTVVTRLAEGDQIREQRLARDFVTRFRELEERRTRTMGWREWVDLVAELAQWEVRLAGGQQAGLREALSTLQASMRQGFARFVQEAYPRWLRQSDDDRPPLSVDVVSEFLSPLIRRRGPVMFVVVDCLRLDQWEVLKSLVTDRFDVEASYYYGILPTATPYARNAIFSGLFPSEIARRHPEWWGERDDESLNQHEAELLIEQLRELHGETIPVRYAKVTTTADGEEMLRQLPGWLAQPGVSALVFNFIDLLTHGRSESAILSEIARDAAALRNLTQTWFVDSALSRALREAARRGVPVLLTTDHGSIHCHTPATVFAKRDATTHLRYKFGDDLRAEDAEAAITINDLPAWGLPKGRLATRLLLATTDRFFVYPTKLREYQARYRGAFLHGGVTPEEMIVPVALLTPALPPDMTRASRLLAWLRPYRGPFVAALALGLLAAVAEGFTYALLLPFLRLLFGSGGAFPEGATALEGALRTVLGGLLSRADGSGALVLVLACIAVALLVKNALLYTAGYLGLTAQEGAVRDLRVALYAGIQQRALSFFREHRGGELAARVLSDADQSRGALYALGQVLRSAATVVVYLAMLMALSWWLALLAGGVILAVTLGLRPLHLAVRRRWVRVVERRGWLGAVTVETAASARAVKAASAEPQEATRFALAAEEVRHGILRAERAAMLASPLAETLAAGAMLTVLALVGLQGGLRPEVFVTFVAVALRMLSPMKAVAQFPAQLAEALAAGDRLFALIDHPAEETDSADARPFPGLGDALEFRNVWVAYDPDRWVLRGVTLRIARGEMVAVVGPSGAGKSTLADLLPRFVEPTRGAVLADGVPLSAYTRRSLRAALGIVSQETILLHESVRANIAYGDRADASPAEVETAARAAGAHGFITRLPAGYDTVIGERGTLLSGGERQRLAIARALLRDPPILILDEATAHLDAEAERDLQDAIARLTAGRTVLVIAHRLVTAARAHRIVVLDRGVIVEEGAPDALLAAGGRYRQLAELQTID